MRTLWNMICEVRIHRNTVIRQNHTLNVVGFLFGFEHLESNSGFSLESWVRQVPRSWTFLPSPEVPLTWLTAWIPSEAIYGGLQCWVISLSCSGSMRTMQRNIKHILCIQIIKFKMHSFTPHWFQLSQFWLRLLPNYPTCLLRVNGMMFLAKLQTKENKVHHWSTCMY